MLPTTPVRNGSAGYNVQMVDAALLPRDKEGIWVLDFAFKPVRLRTVEVDNKRRTIHYLYCGSTSSAWAISATST